jgi:hypothetical protein
MPAVPPTADLVERAALTAFEAALTGFAITGTTMIITGTSTSMCCSRLHRQRHRLPRRDSAAERQGAPPMRWLLRRCRKTMELTPRDAHGSAPPWRQR